MIQQNNFIQQIQKVDQLDRKQLLHQQIRFDKQCKHLSVTYSRALPNLKDTLTNAGTNYRQIKVVKNL